MRPFAALLLSVLIALLALAAPTGAQTPPPITITPTPDPYAGLSIDELAARYYGRGAVTIVETMGTYPEFTRYLISYPSEDLTIYGFMNVPVGEGPFPVVIALHGYIDPAVYGTLDYTTRYADDAALMDYCRRSANPVGRLMLHLYGDTDARHIAYSDAICSSLQLINFLQDVAVDYRKGRIYLPQDELAAHHVTEAQLAGGDTRGLWHMMMHKQIERARKLLQAGAPLGRALKGRVGLELRVTIRGGEAILRKLHADPGCVFENRPVLTKKDWIFMLARGLR